VILHYSDHFVLPLPEGHRFPMRKYGLLRERALAEGLVPPERFCVPEAASDQQLTLVHLPEYVSKVSEGRLTEKELRRLGFPWSPGLVERSRRSVGATIEACREALNSGAAANLAGGTHHAYPDHGEGYCIFNDVAVAARQMQSEGRIRRAIIVDLDVHQGNGTAATFSDDPSVFTFSIHGSRNFPFHKENSDLDIALPDQTGDEEYLQILVESLGAALEAARPDLVIYLAGADPYQGDALGRLGLTKTGLARRDRYAFETFRRMGLPAALTMSGGYARRIEDTVDIHLETLRLAVEIFG
jgi:acetoin utilization deacetylase AcuC-like enzyme